ncbi:MAG TPA: hypothetical protein ENJ18_16605 [Nannocystis exedens]|nr:hypothetical protein [Nannocystis exedens]
MSSEHLAAAARACHEGVLELVALHAEAIAATLGEELGLVDWDRQVVIGRAQRGLRRLMDGGGSQGERALGPGCRVVERRCQPLECLPVLWGALLGGSRVWLGFEAGASTAVRPLLVAIADRLRERGVDSLVVAPIDGEEPEEVASWPLIGVVPADSRLAVIGADGDRELAAYVLARTCLRRSGEEPRSIHHALVCGPTERLQRYLQRLWTGVVVGPAADPGSFCGPVGAAFRDAYLAALERWQATPEVRVLCAGGLLERVPQDGIYLAPALFQLPWPLPEGVPIRDSARLPVVGPMLVLYAVSADHTLETASQALGFPRSRQLWVAPPPLGGIRSDGPRYVQGALIVERMPPGLPEPRPA